MVGESVVGIFAGDLRVAFADVLVAILTLVAALTRDRPVEQDFVTYGNMVDTLANSFDDTGTFVAEHKVATPVERVVVGVANARGFDGNENFIPRGRVDFDGFDGKRSFSIGDGSLGLEGHVGWEFYFAVIFTVRDS